MSAEAPGQATGALFVSIVIPFHNEAENLELLMPALGEACARCAPHRIEVLMVDDLSTDDSLARARRHAAADARFRVLALPQRGGQTGAFRLAFAEARGDYIIRMDADLQDDPADLPKFMEKIGQGYDLIMGVRSERKHGWTLRVLTAIYDTVVGRLFATELHSNSGSFIGFRARFLKDIPFRHNDHRYLPLIAIRRGANRRCNVFLAHRQRAFGRTKYSTLKKALFGGFEVVRFYIRYSTGHYDMPAGRE